MPIRALGPKGGGFGGSPTSIRGRKERQRGRWPQKGEWIVMSHLGWGEEQISKGVATFPRFKALRGSPTGKAQRRQYPLAVDLSHYKFNMFFEFNI